MAYSIKDPATDAIIRKLAKAQGKPIVEAIRDACQAALDREQAKIPLNERIDAIVRRVASYPLREGEPSQTHKEFFDEMWGEDDR
ncbi:MAG: type II toxin-antitoxin system VapB family antitoxin [Methylobacteriaceae bacterium]|nr:type II toxin-antitoxin system VapB family antitoxin [Rhodoblastus sp.]MCC0006358.1 type II toxin-antitoxin system VapB family antitoxin [Methylobacteriaceae bacterium]